MEYWLGLSLAKAPAANDKLQLTINRTLYARTPIGQYESHHIVIFHCTLLCSHLHISLFICAYLVHLISVISALILQTN